MLTKPLGTGNRGDRAEATERRAPGERASRGGVDGVAEWTGIRQSRAGGFARSRVFGRDRVRTARTRSAEMAMGSGVHAASSIRCGPAAAPWCACDWPRTGFLTGGCQRNRAYLVDKVVIAPRSRLDRDVAFDPQTSGGLLIAVAERVASRLVRRLRAKSVDVAVIGRALPKRAAWVYLV